MVRRKDHRRQFRNRGLTISVVVFQRQVMRTPGGPRSLAVYRTFRERAQSATIHACASQTDDQRFAELRILAKLCSFRFRADSTVR